jgi:hypothetical protein
MFVAGKVVYYWEGGGVSIRMCDFEKWHSLNGSVLLRYYLICLYSLCLYIIATITHMEVLLQPSCLSPNKKWYGRIHSTPMPQALLGFGMRKRCALLRGGR